MNISFLYNTYNNKCLSRQLNAYYKRGICCYADEEFNVFKHIRDHNYKSGYLYYRNEYGIKLLHIGENCMNKHFLEENVLSEDAYQCNFSKLSDFYKG